MKPFVRDFLNSVKWKIEANHEKKIKGQFIVKHTLAPVFGSHCVPFSHVLGFPRRASTRLGSFTLAREFPNILFINTTSSSITMNSCNL